MKIIALIAAAMLMSSCEPAERAEQPANVVGDSTMNYVAEVANMPKGARDATLFRAIRDAGLSCQTIIDSQPMPDATPPNASWRAQCEDQAYHLITIQPDGQAMVVSRTTP